MSNMKKGKLNKENQVLLSQDGEFINKISDSLRVQYTSTPSKCDVKSSLVSFKDESNREELTKNQSEENSSENMKNSWTEVDSVCLLFIVNNVGRKWKLIADNYKSHLKNKNEDFFNHKYWNLKKIKFILFEKLKEKAKLVKDVEILMNHKYNLTVSRLRWSTDELIYFVHGVSKYGFKWKLLLKEYKTHFHESRTIEDLRFKYSALKRNPKKLLYFEQKASLLSHQDNNLK